MQCCVGSGVGGGVVSDGVVTEGHAQGQNSLAAGYRSQLLAVQDLASDTGHPTVWAYDKAHKSATIIILLIINMK